MGSSVHDDIGEGWIPAMLCSDSQPTRNVSLAGFVAGGTGAVITKIAPKACRIRLQKRYGGRHTGQLRSSATTGSDFHKAATRTIFPGTYCISSVRPRESPRSAARRGGDRAAAVCVRSRETMHTNTWVRRKDLRR
jgi:hypothetical protein